MAGGMTGGTAGGMAAGRGLPEAVALRWSTPADAGPGSRLHMACWREAYGPIVDPGLLAAQLADPLAWAQRWARPDRAPTLLAETDEGELVGMAAAGPGRHEGDEAQELYALYVRAAWHGTGLGRALFDAVVEPGPCSTWVLEANARARAFYGKCGLTELGGRERFDPLDAWEVRLHRR